MGVELAASAADALPAHALAALDLVAALGLTFLSAFYSLAF